MYSSIQLINEVNMLIQSNSFRFIDGISGADFGLTTEDQNRYDVLSNYYSMRFEDWHLINKGFLNDIREFLTSILPMVYPR